MDSLGCGEDFSVLMATILLCHICTITSMTLCTPYMLVIHYYALHQLSSLFSLLFYYECKVVKTASR